MRFGIVIPYRKRSEHLAQTAPVLSRFGKVFVIEQADDKPFNRGKLINVGYLTYSKYFDYFAAHDVDMLPEKVNYSYSENPCHLATEVEDYGYKLPNEKYFGGVTLFPNDKFEKVNGFSNNFWGWGGEDDYIRRRFEEMNIDLQSRQCRFKSLHHIRNIDQDLRLKNKEILRGDIRWEDGLTSCNFDVVGITYNDKYVLLKVKL